MDHRREEDPSRHLAWDQHSSAGKAYQSFTSNWLGPPSVHSYIDYPYMTSTQQTSPPTIHRSSLSTRTIIYTLAAATLAIIALFIPSLLRGRSLRQLPTLGLGSRYHSTPASTMSEVKLTPREVKEWNVLADGMDRYHTHFRYEFNRVYDLADGSFQKQGMNLQRFMREAAQLSTHLDMHHRIEAYIFPILAKKMPQFKAGAKQAGEHLKSHKAIHDGLDKYDKFLKDVQETPSSYNPDQLRSILDSFRDVLFRHLDEEVEDIGGESLRKAGFTLKEIKQIPM